MKTSLNKNKTVFVGVSGGVDSSVAAAILKEQGYNVVGVFIRTWTPDFIDCTWRDERRDAMRVCAHLDIPFLECDGEDAYKKGVADYMIEEYKKGNTPNPDVMCNREVKFGVFWDFAKTNGADYIATGHYARSIDGKLLKGPDESKDQSYFLWTLKNSDLSHTMFPVGHLPKTQVRVLAKKYHLPTAVKKDSQGVCFLGPLDMKDFLKHYIEINDGDVLDENGVVIGTHNGAIFFTLGERHGFTLNKNLDNSRPLYVISKNIDKNTITVSDKKYSSEDSRLNKVLCSKTSWVNETPLKGKLYDAQIRYHGELFKCKLDIFEEGKVYVIFDRNVLVDKGQSIVVYDGDVCLGGGIVS